MKRITLLLLAIFAFTNHLFSFDILFQDTSGPVIPVLPDTTDLTLDYLKVPNSAAFNLMGISPSSIDEPKVPGDFLVALNNATDDFTKIPKSYAMEFSPAWVFDKANIDFSETISNKIGQNLRQSLVLSIGYNTFDDPMQASGNLSLTEVGIGVKASFLRGSVKSQFAAIESMYQTLGEINDSFYVNTDKWLDTDAQHQMLSDSIKAITDLIQQDNSLSDSLGPMLGVLLSEINSRKATLLQDSVKFKQEVTNNFSNQLTSLKAHASNIKFIRTGFKLDFAAGFVSNFREASFDSARVSKVGAWLTGGWTFNSNNSQNASSILGVLRLTGNPDQLYKSANSLLTDNNLYFDYGGRLIFHNGDKLSISGEIVGRVPINNDLISSTSRYTFNLAYQVSNSIVLTLNLGKDFNGAISNSGNLLTALHLFSYFGNRSYNNDGGSVN